MKRISLAACAAALALATYGCAGSVQRWIVDTRIHQGDAALANGSLHEAATAYRLALRISPDNARARAGFSSVSGSIADADFRTGNYDDALATINTAQKYDPANVRLQALRSQIDDARLKRAIVVSNYPTYRAAGAEIQALYDALGVQDKLIAHSLHRFAYTYDTQDLTRAIQDSYDLQRALTRVTNRLIVYRQLVQSGAPAAGKSAAATVSGSLLPLP